MRTAKLFRFRHVSSESDQISQRGGNCETRFKRLLLIHVLAAVGVVCQLNDNEASDVSGAWPACLIASWMIACLCWRWHDHSSSDASGNGIRTDQPLSAAILFASTGWAMLTAFIPDDSESHLVLGSILIVLASGTVYATPTRSVIAYASLCCILLPVLSILVSGSRSVRLTLLLYAGTVACVVLAGYPWRTRTTSRSTDASPSRVPNPELENELLRHATALRKAEQALSIAEQACVDKTRFLTAASHDLRQPMHAVTLFVAALKSEVVDGRARYLVDRLDRSLSGLDDLFNRLLDIGRLDAGVVTPTIKMFDAVTMLDTLESRFSAVAASKSLDFRIRARPGLRIKSDPALLIELISNLLSNAFRYTEHGGVLLGIRPAGGKLRIQVIDTGCGIPEYHFDRIFEEFFQLNNPSRDRRKGSGLGLAIVKRLAQVLGHTIKLRSRVGYGSSFELLVEGGMGDSDRFSHPCSSIDHCAIKGALVLVVDDEVDILAAMEAVLTSWGCHCIAARSSQEAVRYIENSPRFPDIVISDHRLANHHTCFDVAAAVATAVPFAVPMIVISGECSASFKSEVKAMGWQFLSKPVNAMQLHDTISGGLDDTAMRLSKAA